MKHDDKVNGLGPVNGQQNSGESTNAIDGRNNKDLGAKLDHCHKVLCDYETQLQEVVLLNKELLLKINERESEVMNLNCELLKHQETLSVYEQGFKHLSADNSKLDAGLRDERKRGAELSEKLDDAEGYISCITDKVASYEVELKYLRQELKKRDKKPT
jgi:chromosome segregation ATPase